MSPIEGNIGDTCEQKCTCKHKGGFENSLRVEKKRQRRKIYIGEKEKALYKEAYKY